jgi:hypothetical protein
MLAKTGIGLFGFLVAVGADEAVENLSERQRQVIPSFQRDFELRD